MRIRYMPAVAAVLVVCLVAITPVEAQDRSPLAPEDHTLIMQSVLSNPIRIIRQLGPVNLLESGQMPSGTQVLTAAMQVETVRPFTKRRIRLVLEQVLEQQERLGPAAEELSERASDFENRVGAARSITELADTLISILQDLERGSHPYVGVRTALDILYDGRSTIYSENSAFYELISARQDSLNGENEKPPTLRDHIVDVGKEDVIWAISGAAGGCTVGAVVGPPGCLAGAKAGAIGTATTTSAATAIGKVVDWLFGD